MRLQALCLAIMIAALARPGTGPALAQPADWVALELKADEAVAAQDWAGAEAHLAQARQAYLDQATFDAAVYADLILRQIEMILMQEEPGRAVFVMQDAVQTFITRAGDSHPELVGLYQRLGDIRGMRGQWRRGHHLYIRATHVAERAFGADSFSYLEARLRYLNWVRKYRRAKRFRLRRSFRSMVGEPEDYSDLSKSLNVRLAWARLAQSHSQLDRARQLLEDGWRLVRDGDDLGPAIRWNYAAALARLYRRMGNDELIAPLIRAAAIAPDDPYAYAPLLTVDIAFPDEAEAQGMEPWVIADVDIDAGGRVTDVAITNSTGNEAFEQAVARAMMQWRFAPARVDGEAVPRRITDQRYRVVGNF